MEENEEYGLVAGNVITIDANDNTLKEITTMMENSQKAIEEQISKVKENDRDKIN